MRGGVSIFLAIFLLSALCLWLSHCPDCHRLRGSRSLLGYEAYARDIDESEGVLLVTKLKQINTVIM